MLSRCLGPFISFFLDHCEQVYGEQNIATHNEKLKAKADKDNKFRCDVKLAGIAAKPDDEIGRAHV